MRFSRLTLGVLLLSSSDLLAGGSVGDSMLLEVETASQASSGETPRLSDAEIRKILIAESIAAYSGSCPCPYSTARNGTRCGRRSAWSRAGGEAPLCYPKDVSEEMVRQYRDGVSEG